MDIAGQDGWLSIVFGVGYGFIVLGLAHFAGPMQTGISMPAWIETVLGTIVGRLVNVLFLLHFIIVLAIAFRHTTDLISIAILMETPTSVLLILLGFPVALGARLGIEVLGRTAFLYLIIAVVSFVLLGLSIGGAVDLGELKPVFGSGAGPVFLGALVPGAFLSELFIVLWFFPYIKERRTLFKGAITALALIGAFTLLLTVYAKGVFGFREVERMLFPALNLVRAIRLGGVVERLDVVLISVWLLAIFLKTALFAFLASRQLAWVAGSTNFRRFVFPLTAVAALLSMGLADNVGRFAEFMTGGGFIPFTFAFSVALPILLIIAKHLRTNLRLTKEGDAQQ